MGASAPSARQSRCRWLAADQDRRPWRQLQSAGGHRPSDGRSPTGSTACPRHGAGFDPLRDEAGVETSVRREPSMVHAFFSIGALPGGMRRIARICHEMGPLMARRTLG